MRLFFVSSTKGKTNALSQAEGDAMQERWCRVIPWLATDGSSLNFINRIPINF